MATATKEPVITLRLSPEEACYLRMVLWHVGGSPRGPRGIMDDITAELSKHAALFEDLDLPEIDISGSVSINFEEKA